MLGGQGVGGEKGFAQKLPAGHSVGVTALIMLLPPSTTNTVPLDDTATPKGLEKLAAAPWPFADPAVVLTSPLGVMALIMSLLESATNTVPLDDTATPVGR